MHATGDLEADLALALRLADAASAVSLAYFRQAFDTWNKSDGSITTAADVATEQAIRMILERERPGDAILGEEGGQAHTASRRWVLDPIDGTIEFAEGKPDWATLIALEVDGRVVIAVCDAPARKRRHWAEKGGGAYRSIGSNSTPIKLHVSRTRDLAQARSFVPPARWQPTERSRRVAEKVSSSTIPTPLVDHPALQVALGGYDVAIFLVAGPWDLAAPLLVVEEAGGRFTDIDGKYDWSKGTAVFSNSLVHDDVLALIAQA